MDGGLPGITSPPWSERTKRTVAVIVLLVLGLLALRLSDVWSPLMISVVLAYLLSPMVAWFQRHIPFGGARLRRALGTVLAYVATVTVIVITILVLVPAIVEQMRGFAQGIPALVSEIGDQFESVLSSPISIGGQTVVPLEALEALTGFNPNQPPDMSDFDLLGAAQNFLAPLASPVLGALGSVVSGFLNIIFVLVMVFYLMKDGPHFVLSIERLTPENYRADVRYLFYRLAGVWDAYLRGQVLLCLIMGMLGFLAATIFGVRNPVILGLLNGVLEFIPNVGPALALVPAALLALFFPSSTIPGLHGVLFAGVVILVWTGLQNLEAVVIVPRVMGTSLDLHPFVVILAVLGGASLAGALGVILAAPVVATLRVAGEYIYTKLLDQPPPSLESGEAPSGPGALQRALYWVLRLTGRRTPVRPLPIREEQSS